jgi:hypothetical protein
MKKELSVAQLKLPIADMEHNEQDHGKRQSDKQYQSNLICECYLVFSQGRTPNYVLQRRVHRQP